MDKNKFEENGSDKAFQAMHFHPQCSLKLLRAQCISSFTKNKSNKKLHIKWAKQFTRQQFKTQLPMKITADINVVMKYCMQTFIDAASVFAQQGTAIN